MSRQLSRQLSPHLIFGPSSKGVQRLVEGRSIRALLGSFGASARLPSCFFCSPLPLGVKRPKTGQKQASSAHVDKRAATIKNAPRRPSESFPRPHEKGPKASPPSTGKISRPDTKKAAKPAARRHFSTFQPPHVNFHPTFSPENRSSCKANVNQCKLFSHFVLSHLHTPEGRNYSTFSTLRVLSQYQTISHFVLRPIHLDYSS